jgi:hypothetical protein
MCLNHVGGWFSKTLRDKKIDPRYRISIFAPPWTMFETSACLFQRPSSFLCLPSETKTLHAMLPVSIGNIAARVAFSPRLSKSCVSVLFCNNQFNQGSPLFSGDSLDFSVTTESLNVHLLLLLVFVYVRM